MGEIRGWILDSQSIETETVSVEHLRVNTVRLQKQQCRNDGQHTATAAARVPVDIPQRVAGVTLDVHACSCCELGHGRISLDCVRLCVHFKRQLLNTPPFPKLRQHFIRFPFGDVQPRSCAVVRVCARACMNAGGTNVVKYIYVNEKREKEEAARAGFRLRTQLLQRGVQIRQRL